MKQNIDPKLFVAVIAVVLIVAGVALWRVFSAPSAPVASHGKVTPGMGRGMIDEMRAAHMGGKSGTGDPNAAGPNGVK